MLGITDPETGEMMSDENIRFNMASFLVSAATSAVAMFNRNYAIHHSRWARDHKRDTGIPDVPPAEET
jgi:hypothetical protein